MTSIETLQARLIKIDTAIDLIISGGVAESKLNDMQIELWVKTLSLRDLNSMRDRTIEEIYALTQNAGGGYYVS
jgi:hypothetical protein